MRAAILLAAVAALAWPAAAAQLELPQGARRVGGDATAAGSHMVPAGPHAPGGVPRIAVEGSVARDAWRVDGTDLTTLQLIAPLREQLAAAGYEILLDCAARACGGFDFRAATMQLRPPEMFVDVFDYRFVSARRGAPGADPDYATLLASRAGADGYIEVIRIGPAALPAAAAAAPEAAPEAPAPEPAPSLAGQLARLGRAVLWDLEFEPGSARLGEGPFESLDALGAFLAANPGRRVLLVGHTDSTGGLEGNVAVSRERAAAVRERLAGRHGVPAAQMESNGVGYMAPAASNATEAGREANRRVEAVLLGDGG